MQSEWRSTRSERNLLTISIYKWLDGRSANHVTLDEQSLESLAFELATFLKELQAITDVEGPGPGVKEGILLLITWFLNKWNVWR